LGTPTGEASMGYPLQEIENFLSVGVTVGLVFDSIALSGIADMFRTMKMVQVSLLAPNMVVGVRRYSVGRWLWMTPPPFPRMEEGPAVAAGSSASRARRPVGVISMG
jgi:hypothetical protein